MIRSILTPRAIRRFALSIVVLFFMMVLFNRPTATGNDNNPKQVLLRLEDVGPGGQYAGLEGLGKLKAVIDLLQEHQVSYQVAVVPRWINIAKDGTRYDESIDQSDRPYVRAFDGLLKAAAQNGAILGMHGYTHQVGDTYRSDGDHESGAGNEFNVQDVAETMTEAYAAKRAEAGADLFKKAGLFPYFWEAPHFRTLAKQDAVFRNYFGLHFQANMHTNRLAQQPFYMTGRNRGYGASSLGAVYVPTPLSYIPFNRDIDMVTKQLGKSSKLPALFFHPFLEFDYLTAVLDDEGNPQMAEGLPVYQYRDGGKSRLQKLIAYLSAHGYSFISITDLIPFIPAHSVPVGTEKQGKVQIADVTGDGQADVVSWDDSKGQVTVAEGQFRGLRNEAMPAARVWNELKLGKGDVWTLFDDNGDGQADLWVMRTNGVMESYRSNGSGFVKGRSWSTPQRNGLRNLQALRNGDRGWVLIGETKDGSSLESFRLSGEQLAPLASRRWNRTFAANYTIGDLDGDGRDSIIIPAEHSSDWIELVMDESTMSWKRNMMHLTIPTGDSGQVRIADFNGDGRADVLFWMADARTFAVYQQTEPMQFSLLSRMGPWGYTSGELFARDMNGDGRVDLAVMTNMKPYVDLALSFQSKQALHFQ